MNDHDAQDDQADAEKPKSERQQIARQHPTTGQMIGTHRLTEKQEAFAGHIADGMPVGKAATAAGYTAPHSEGSRARRTPAVAARVLELQRMRLGRTGALAIRVIEDVMAGKIAAPASVRVDAAKYVLKVNGVELQADKRSDAKDLRHMTMAELMEIAAAFKAKTAPVVPGDDAQVIDGTAQSVT